MAGKTEQVEQEQVADAEVVPTGSSNYDVASAIAGLNDSSAAFYTSIKGTDFGARKLIAAAQTKSEPLADNLHKEIALRNFIIQSVQIENEQTGEVNDAPRVTLIDDQGNAFHGTSVGLLSALRNLISTLGEPDTWPEAVPVRVVEQRGRRGYRFMTIELV